MTTTILDIGTLITHSDEIKNGKPIITGTGITVNRIVSWYKLGLTPEEILNRIGHPHLNLAKILDYATSQKRVLFSFLFYFLGYRFFPNVSIR